MIELVSGLIGVAIGSLITTLHHRNYSNSKLRNNRPTISFLSITYLLKRTKPFQGDLNLERLS